IGMTRKVVGPTGSWRRRWAILLSIVLVVGAGVVIVRAVHDTGQFQLDGDASSFTNTVGTPSALDDWDKVCNEVTHFGVAGCGTTGTAGPGRPPFDSTKPCVVLSFGSDRPDTTGDGQQGFWFFQTRSGSAPTKSVAARASRACTSSATC